MACAPEPVADFLSSRRVAVAGVSPGSGSAASPVYRKLRYQFASFKVEGGSLQRATHDLGPFLMPSNTRPSTGQPSGVELAFCAPDVAAAYRRTVDSGARGVAEPKEMPWGQTVAYVRSIEGTFVGICSPLPG
jgi:predicted enzyme related to lactoylglutathione lyase